MMLFWKVGTFRRLSLSGEACQGQTLGAAPLLFLTLLPVKYENVTGHPPAPASKPFLSVARPSSP